MRVSELAQEKINNTLSEGYLRVSVDGGGCSGFRIALSKETDLDRPLALEHSPSQSRKHFRLPCLRAHNHRTPQDLRPNLAPWGACHHQPKVRHPSGAPLVQLVQLQKVIQSPSGHRKGIAATATLVRHVKNKRRCKRIC